MAAAWFNGVQRRICLDYNDTVNKLFRKCFTDSASIANHSHHSHVHTRANHCTPHLKKQADLYLQRHELDRDFAGGSVSFCASKLTVVY